MLKLSLLQQKIKIGDYTDNFSRAFSALKASAAGGCQLAVLPELWSTGYDMDNMEDCFQFNLQKLPFLQALADESSMAIAGTYVYKDSHGYRNRFLFIRPQSPVIYYDKMHLFPLLRELNDFVSGEQRIIARWQDLDFHLATCYDLRFPEQFRISASFNYFAGIVPAQWPLSRSHHWLTLQQARSIENQCYMISVNGVGKSGNTDLGGNSLVADPFGEIVVQCSTDEEELRSVEIDTERVGVIRKRYPFLPK